MSAIASTHSPSSAQLYAPGGQVIALAGDLVKDLHAAGIDLPALVRAGRAAVLDSAAFGPVLVSVE